MTVFKLFYIAVGSVVGAWLRWLFMTLLNNFLPHFPLGTLLTNLLGGYLIGLSAAWLAHQPNWEDPMRWLLIVGFLGAFTTFSSFSLESVQLLQKGLWGWAMAHALGHMVGAIALTFAGFASYRYLFQT